MAVRKASAKADETPVPPAGKGATLARPDKNWYAVLVFEQAYSKPVSKEDTKSLDEVMRKVVVSGLPLEKRKKLIEYLKLGQTPAGGRFSLMQSEGIVSKYLAGEVAEEHLDFEVDLMKAWCDGKIDNFIAQERGSLKLDEDEMARVDNMLDMALSRSPIIKVIAATALRAFHPMRSADERTLLIGQAAALVESARSVKE